MNTSLSSRARIPGVRVPMRRSGKRRRLHPEKARGNCFAFAGARGFARPDLAATVGVAIILLLFFGAGRVGERGRTARCAANLAALGRATQSFADDHEDALPPAAIEPGSVAWDAQVAPYLPPNRVKKGMGPSFQCPSDPLADARARSYAMSAHDMQPENWPPGPDNVTGVGLVWNKESMDRLLDEEHRKMAVSDPDSLALMKRAFGHVGIDRNDQCREQFERDSVGRHRRSRTAVGFAAQEPYPDSCRVFQLRDAGRSCGIADTASRGSDLRRSEHLEH